MKKITLLLVSSLFLFALAPAQVPGACGKNKNPIPNDGSGSLGQTYNYTVCGLNYVKASALVETRYNAYTTDSTLGYGLPVTLAINGLPSSNTILKAYIWYLVSYTEATTPSTTVTITNPASNTISMSSGIAGTSVSKCWGETGTAAYRSDVTSAISGNGNYILNISGFSNPALEVDGATLFIIYKDPSATYQGSLVIWDGAMATSSGGILSQTGTGFSTCSTPSSARAFAISSDHQDNISLTHPTTLNGVTSTFPNSMYNYDEAPVTLTAGQTTSAFGESDGGNGDCYLWGVMGLYYQTTNCAVCSPCLTTTVTLDSVKNTTSCILNNGAIYISTSTTAPPLSYNWSNGATTQNITGISAGSYSVSITDTIGCTTYLYATVGSPSTIVIADTIKNIPCSGGSGAIYASASGGTNPLTYSWSNSATTQDITGLSAGNYSVTVTDAAGCSTSQTFSVTAQTMTANIMIVSNASCSTCCDGKAIVGSVIGGTAPYTYQWYDPQMQTTIVATGLCAGSYAVCVTDANGCTSCNTVTISTATGIYNLSSLSLSLEIFPNPTTGKANVIISQFENLKINSIEIYNVYGEKVYDNNHFQIGSSSSFQIDLSSQPSGVYFIKVQSENGISVKKIIKE